MLIRSIFREASDWAFFWRNALSWVWGPTCFSGVTINTARTQFLCLDCYLYVRLTLLQCTVYNATSMITWQGWAFVAMSQFFSTRGAKFATGQFSRKCDFSFQLLQTPRILRQPIFFLRLPLHGGNGVLNVSSLNMSLKPLKESDFRKP